jgi:hypothetical protein
MLPRRIFLQGTRLWPTTQRWQTPIARSTQRNGERLGLGRRIFSTEAGQVSSSEGVSAGTGKMVENESQAVQPASPSQPELQIPQGAGAQSQEPTRTHQFDTFKLVSALQIAGYSHPQAVALMKCLRTVLVNGNEVAKAHYLSRGDLENVPWHLYMANRRIGDISFPSRNV